MKACRDCGAPVKSRGAIRCKSCSTAQRHHPNKPFSRVRFDGKCLNNAIKRGGVSRREVERRAGLKTNELTDRLRRKTMPVSVIDRVACVLGRHYTEFEEAR